MYIILDFIYVEVQIVYVYYLAVTLIKPVFARFRTRIWEISHFEMQEQEKNCKKLDHHHLSPSFSSLSPWGDPVVLFHFVLFPIRLSNRRIDNRWNWGMSLCSERIAILYAIERGIMLPDKLQEGRQAISVV